MKSIGFVYLTTCLINGKVYVGQHKFSDYTKHYFGSGTLIEQALKKYGKNNFRRNILKVCYTVNQLNGWEVYYTLKYNPNLDRKVGYNQIIGPVHRCGNRNPACYPEIRKKMVKANRRTTLNEEYREKQSEIMKDYFKTHEPHFKGCKHSEETRKKMSKSMKGRTAWNKGVPMSEERKRLQSEKMKGRYIGSNNPNYKS